MLPAAERTIPDPHSLSNPDRVRVRHVAIDLTVRFDSRTLEGTADLDLERPTPGETALFLDTRALDVRRVEAGPAGGALAPARFRMELEMPILGARLVVELPEGATRVRIGYATRPEASALQWLDPAQTAGGTRPFLFTQSQAIHARSWIPIQDTPAVRMTYEARLRVPPGLTALMSAERGRSDPEEGLFEFRMPQPIPAYLIALAVGELAFAPLGARCGVWAEPPVLGRAAGEFEDTEAMIAAAESLFGPYRWDRYDILVLPPSFPYGGMENPRLTFATPTLLAGDRSLVSVVAHELAHSWSGNLVTSAGWGDFWLNEGFTTYCERRILERVFGGERAEMEWALGRQTLDALIGTLPAPDQALRIPLEGRDPDLELTELVYEKGALLLRTLERAAGRERFDVFLRRWFDGHAFESVDSEEFLRSARRDLSLPPDRAVDLDAWLDGPGVPPGAVPAQTDALDRVDELRTAWLSARIGTAALPGGAWSTLEWLRFLRGLPADLPASRREDLDRTFDIGARKNAEIAFQWLLLAVQSGQEAAVAERLERFLVSIGRRKFVKPLFEELVRSPAGRRLALAIYGKARPGYHPLMVETVDRIVAWAP